MSEKFYQGTDEDFLSIIPEFDTTTLSSSAQRRIRRVEETETTEAIIKSTRASNHNKVTLVALLCQGQADEAVAMLLQRNPRRYAAENLFAISRANAEYLYRIVSDGYDDFWR